MNDILRKAKQHLESIEQQEHSSNMEEYQNELERRTQEILAMIDGMGEVSVRITLKDQGSYQVEKDRVTENHEDIVNDSKGATQRGMP